MSELPLSPAEQASAEAFTRIQRPIDEGRSFLLEAGAGAGKTFSLVQALKYVIKSRGTALVRHHQQVACITFTNVASNEIEARTDNHPAIRSSTIHAFCWSIIKDFQSNLRKELPRIADWSKRLEELGGVGTRRVSYDELGRRTVEAAQVSVHHDDVLELTIRLLGNRKFRALLTARFPILLIDEYQDTNKGLAQALTTYFLGTGEGPLIGFFGDHWQKIYGEGCGKIEHRALEIISKESNFRSAPVIVECLNRIRPDLPQRVADESAEGSIAVYHTNDWVGKRRDGQHWKGDLPSSDAHDHLEALKKHLTTEGWVFLPEKTKILMLTHKVLAEEQSYSGIAEVFPRNDAFIKKEDPYIKFLVDTLEPMCIAYGQKRFGEMFAVVGSRAPAIRSRADKANWADEMDQLLKLRQKGTIGDVIDLLKRAKRLSLSEPLDAKERELEQRLKAGNVGDLGSLERVVKLKAVEYQEVVALAQFINEMTPFATKHGVKGAEFENVLVVLGRGWNQYNFNQFLEWAIAPGEVASDRWEAYERNRNLFYVVASRPKKRLAMLFTQSLTEKAVTTLAHWFGKEAIHSWQISS